MLSLATGGGWVAGFEACPRCSGQWETPPAPSAGYKGSAQSGRSRVRGGTGGPG